MEDPNRSALRQSVLLFVQRAMLGEVFPALRALSVHWDTKSIHISAFVDGEPQSTDIESISCIETEMMADFLDSFQIDTAIIRCDAPSQLPSVGSGVWVYARRES
jgi:hypothetical protein